MSRYTKAIIFSRILLILSLILSFAYDLLYIIAFVMCVFVYDNADEITYITCIFNVLFTSCFVGAIIVLARRYIEQIRNVKKAYDGDIKAHLEECDNIISSRFFFFHDHFISFDNPMICDYDEIHTVYHWYRPKCGKGSSYYMMALKLKDGRIFYLNCTSKKGQNKTVGEFKKYAPTVKTIYAKPK